MLRSHGSGAEKHKGRYQDRQDDVHHKYHPHIQILGRELAELFFYTEMQSPVIYLSANNNRTNDSRRIRNGNHTRSCPVRMTFQLR